MHSIVKGREPLTAEDANLAFQGAPLSGLLQLKLSPNRRWVYLVRGLEVLAKSPVDKPQIRVDVVDGKGICLATGLPI